MQEQLNNIENDLKEVKDALLGTKYGQDGLVDRIDKVEKYQNNDKKQKWTIAGMGIVVAGLVKYWDKIFH